MVPQPERDSSPSSDMTDIDVVETGVPERLPGSDGEDAVDDALHQKADEEDRDSRSGRSSSRKRYLRGSQSLAKKPAKRRR